jgi:hypothetical protein
VFPIQVVEDLLIRLFLKKVLVLMMIVGSEELCLKLAVRMKTRKTPQIHTPDSHYMRMTAELCRQRSR